MANEVRRLETADLFLWVMVGTTLFFIPSAMDVFNFPKQWFLLSTTIGVLIHFKLTSKSKIRKTDSESLFLGFSIAFLILFMSSSAIFTDTTLVRSLFGYPGRANGLITYTCIFVLAWIGHRMSIPPGYEARLLKRAVGTILIFGLYCLLQFLNFDPVPWNNPFNRIIGTFGNPNFSGAFLGSCSVTIFILAVTARTKRKWPLLTCALILLFLAIATESLQALGIFIVGGVVGILAYANRHLSKFQFMALLICVVALLISALISFLGRGPLGDQFYQYTLRLRFEYWRVGLNIVREFPLFGIGPDSYVEGFRLFKGSNFVKTYSQNVTADSAHNVLINFLSNFGIPAFLLFFGIICLVSRNALTIIFSRKNSGQSVTLISYLWILLLVQSLFSLEQIGLNVFQWICGALLLNRKLLDSESNELKKIKQEELVQSRKALVSLKTEISVLAMVVVFMSNWNFIRQEIAIQRLASISSGTKLSEKDIELKTSSFNFFSKDEVRRVIYITDFLLKIERYGEAKSLLSDLVEKDPQAYEGWEQLARIARFESDFKAEIAFRTRIEELDPFNYSNFLSMAEALKQVGDVVKSRLYIDKVLELTNESATQNQARSLLNS